MRLPLLRALAVLLPPLAACATPAEEAEAPRRPNVLLIVADDLAAVLGTYGHPTCRTPNLDALAARGVRFDVACCQFPVCGPSRASFLTGLYPTASGVLGNGGDFRETRPDHVTLPQLFRAEGYAVERIGKLYHMGVPGDIMRGTPGVDDEASWDRALDLRSPEIHSLGVRRDCAPGVSHQGVDFLRIELEGDGSEQHDHLAADAAIEALERLAEDPFFLAVGFVRPHVPLVAPAPYFAPYPDASVVVPAQDPDDPLDMPERARSQTNAVKYQMSDADARGATAAYFASVSYLDAQVGRVLEALERLGLAGDTVVVFTSDHGYHLGQHTMWQKLSLLDDCLRVPLIVASPRSTARDAGCDALVELIDVYPTLAALCDLPTPREVQGHSFRALLDDPASAAWERDDVYAQNHRGADGLRTDAWKIVAWPVDGGEEYELYDLRADPGELVNLANEPSASEALNEMRARLERARVAAGVLAPRS